MNVEQLKQKAKEEFDDACAKLSHVYHRRLEALNWIEASALPPIAKQKAIPLRTHNEKTGLANRIRAWVSNGAPKEFTSNDVSKAIGESNSKVSIACYGLASTGDLRVIRREYFGKKSHRNVYARASR